MALAPKQLLLHYLIARKIGAGGMGEVYRAQDTKLKRDVAIKVLPAEMSAQGQRLERFQRETDGVNFLCMELVEGRPLDALVSEGGLPLERIFAIAEPVADALAAAHAKGITHRDLKPPNVMVGDDGRVKILDFGLAKLRQDVRALEATQLPTELLTQEGLALGTVPYMSPEQAEGKEVDHRSDIFSLGVMLYEMASGRRPFTGDTTASLVSSILRDAPPSVTELNQALPRHLGRIIGRCLKKNPADRYQSARDVYNELRGLRREVASGATPVSSEAQAAARSTLRVRWAWLGAAAVALTVVAVGLWAWRQAGTPGGGARQAPVSKAAAGKQMIAVLPFDNLGSAEDEYFAAGMAEEITSRLSTVEGLGVIFRKSAKTYAGSSNTTQQIGAELGVDYLVEGTVRWARSGDGAGRVRITPKLIRVVDDVQVWSTVFDRVIDDIFDVQSEIASRVIDELGITRLEPERRFLAAAPTDNVEAYSAYLRGKDYTVQWDADSLNKAVATFERAVEVDPGFAAAWAELGRAQAMIVHFGVDRSQSRIDASRAAVERALELAPESPQSHQALGMYRYHALKDYAGAQEAFAAADRLQPDIPEVLEGRGLVQRRQGRWEDSTRNMERAVRLSPRDENLLINLGSNVSGQATAFFPRPLASATNSRAPELPASESQRGGSRCPGIAIVASDAAKRNGLRFSDDSGRPGSVPSVSAAAKAWR